MSITGLTAFHLDATGSISSSSPDISKNEAFRKLLMDSFRISWTPRRIEWFKVNFGLDILVQELKAALKSSMKGNDDADTTSRLYNVLSLTASLAIDLQVVKYLYSAKMHNLMANYSAEDSSPLGDLLELLIDKIISHSVKCNAGSGGGATSSVCIIEQSPLLVYDFRNSTKNTGSAVEGEGNKISKLHLRRVDDPMYGHGQYSVGYIMWPSALILSSWIFQNRTVFSGKSVLELGSGLGLSGIAAAGFCKSEILSDFNDRVLETLEWNLNLNTFNAHKGLSGKDGGKEEGDEEEVTEHISLDGNFEHIDPAKADVRVCHFDWNVVLKDGPNAVTQPFSFYRSKDVGVHGIVHRLHLPSQIAGTYDCRSCFIQQWSPEGLQSAENPSGEAPTVSEQYSDKFPCISSKDEKTFDLVIGSDLICCDRDAILVTNVVKRMLSPVGVAIIVLAQPQHRYGIELFVPALLSADFEVYWRPIISRLALSQYAKSFPEDHPVFAGTYFGCENTSKWAESIDSAVDFGDSFLEMNEELLRSVEERDYQGWDLVICRIKKS